MNTLHPALFLRSSIVAISISAFAASLAQAQSAPAATQKPAAAKPAAAAAAAPRVVEIVGSDNMKYSIATIAAKRGEELTVRLTATGAMPKVAMAHNFILLKKTADPAAFANAGAMARATDFIAPAMKDQVLAATGLVGNGEVAEVTFKAPTAPGTYTFLCTFPGHFAVGMKGTLVVK